MDTARAHSHRAVSSTAAGSGSRHAQGSAVATAAGPHRTQCEREVKLTVGADFRLGDLSRLVPGAEPSPVRERHLTTVYWDSPDLRLIRWGCTLRHRGGEGWTVKLPRLEDSAVLVRDEHTFPGPAGSPPEAALDLVRAYLRTAPVSAVARMRTVRRAVSLHDPQGRALVEIDDDEVSVRDGGRTARHFREVEVELTELGSRHLLETVVERLIAGGAGAADPIPKVIRALGRTALGSPDVAAPDVDLAENAGAAVRVALAASVTRLLRHDAGVRLGGDPEAVHQARVATCRLRSDLRTFAPLVDPAWAAPLSGELRWLGGELGRVRDIEVLWHRLQATAGRLPEPEVEGGRAVAALLCADLDEARERLQAALHQRRYLALLDRLVEAVRSPALTDEAGGPPRRILPRLVSVPWSRLWRLGRRLDAASADEDLHALRIRAKRCRYAAEAVGAAVGERAAHLAAAAAALQTVLGEHQDAVIAAAWLRQRGPTSADPVAAGHLRVLERNAATAARRAWPAAWDRLADPRLTHWLPSAGT